MFDNIDIRAEKEFEMAQEYMDGVMDSFDSEEEYEAWLSHME